MSLAKAKKGRFTSRRVGGLRPSQMIHTYGPGAVVDLPGLSVVLGGTDNWNVNHSERILEPRLIGAVRAIPGCHLVAEFRTPPWEDDTGSPFDEWARIGVPVHPFPAGCAAPAATCCRPSTASASSSTCPSTDRTRPATSTTSAGAAGRRPSPPVSSSPARTGTSTTFPGRSTSMVAAPAQADRCWSSRRPGEPTEPPTCGSSARPAERTVWSRTPSALTPPTTFPAVGAATHTLQRFDAACSQPTRALLLGASNAWFAVYRSALTIPTVTGEIEQKVAEHWDDLTDIDDRAEFDFIIKRLVKGTGEKALRWVLQFDADDVWTAIVDRRAGHQGDTGTGDLRAPEWEAFTAAVPPKSDDFRVRALDVPAGFKKTLDHPIAVDRLREVQALCGFTRIDSPADIDAGRIAPLWKSPQSWLPAAEVRGEGLLIRLPEARVEQWEKDYEAGDRYRDLRQATRNWRTRRGLDPAVGMPPARFVLLHTLAHLLLHQVALECGYSTASIRERLYSRAPGDALGPPMAGVLLYTASPDSEGTLGGLVSLSEPSRLASLLRDAVARAKLCSTDPMCADHRAGDLGDTLHNAACHACMFTPETSCEAGNRYLDRGAVVPILGHEANAWFR